MIKARKTSWVEHMKLEIRNVHKFMAPKLLKRVIGNARGQCYFLPCCAMAILDWNINMNERDLTLPLPKFWNYVYLFYRTSRRFITMGT